MNKKFYQSLCLLLLVFGPIFLFAQPKLRITSMTSNPIDTAYSPSTPHIAYTVVVENVGNNQLTGNCILKQRYNTGIAEHTKWTWQAFNFEVGEKDTFVFNDTIGVLGGSRYNAGGNIIVIWPHSENPNAQAPDTTTFPMFIVDLLGIRDRQMLFNRVKVYPNPATDHVSIQYLEARNKLERVRFVALDGRLLKESNQPLEDLDLSDLPAGMYFVQFKYRDGVEGAMRIQKQD